MDDIYYLDPFLSEVRPGHGTAMPLVTPMDDLYRQQDRASVTFLLLIDFSVDLIQLTMVSSWAGCMEWVLP